jgi:lipopolysaccharide transport system ATP-binding protein
MSSEPAIRAEGVAKSYRIRHAPGPQAGGSVGQRLRSVLRREPAEQFAALRGVSVSIGAGEVVGIMGPNGAGKSTFLKILSRITAPTSGRIDVWGRVGSLLEVGTGFHPELTGRENIYLNGTILGMRRREIARRFDEIVDYAGVERFLDTPVKRYSSGMYVRLAFAVAAHLDSEILLVDEVLAVGDAAFQRKSLGTMGDVARGGRTVLLVSHNAATIAALATRCLLLRDGMLVADGPAEDIVSAYGAAGAGESASWADATRPEDWHDQRLRLAGGWPEPGTGLQPEGEVRRFRVVIDSAAEVTEPRVMVTLHRGNGDPVGTAFSAALPAVTTGQRLELAVGIGGAELAPGPYYLTVAVGVGDELSGYEHFDVVTNVCHFEAARPGGGVWHYPWGPVRLRVLAEPVN